MRTLDVERVRLSAERDAYAALAREELWAPAIHVPQDVAVARDQLRRSALCLTETMAPEAYAAAHEAMTALGVDDAIELFLSGGNGADTARLVLYGDPIGIELIGGYLGTLDHGGLVAVLGHEIGHRLAHRGRSRFERAHIASLRGKTRSQWTYAIAAELTADRFGLLACRDLDAVLRLEMQTAAGRSARAIHFDTKGYLEQCRRVGEGLLERGRTLAGTTHPEHYVRGYAEWLFSETDLYASLTGRGNGTRTIGDVDRALGALLGIREREATPPRARATEMATNTTPAPPPVASTPDLLTDRARRTLSAATEPLATGARALTSSLERFATTVQSRWTGPGKGIESPLSPARPPTRRTRGGARS